MTLYRRGASGNSGAAHAIADDTTVTVTNLATGEILSTHTIEPDRPYWRNTQRAPGRWPGAQ